MAETQFRAQIKLKMTSEDEVHKWLEDFQSSSGLTWRKSKTYPNTGRYNAYRLSVEVPSTLTRDIKVELVNTADRSGDPHIKDGYLLNINLRHEHNHGVSRAEAVRKRDVSEKTIAKLKTLFESGHSPSSALHTIKHELQEQEGENYIHASADRSICPDVHFCYRLYYKLFQRQGIRRGIKSTKGPSGEQLEEMIQQFCRSLTEKLKGDPQTFTAPIHTFLGTYNKINDASLASALHCFGKKKNLQSSKMIGVRPTAIARRKAALGGSRAATSGRPPTRSKKEYPYSKKQQHKKSAPQSMSKCAEENTSLGGSLVQLQCTSPSPSLPFPSFPEDGHTTAVHVNAPLPISYFCT
ncbi:hypothetical protein N1851_022537 [Merluccius polli]|uniref:Uncharacterized protein n=1 Tax=Merluccius polli TaxID=89951 RepID=A0AA47MHN4_MERPO|nr:hypothetical protein N1851_022537 [Merluccius polli]